MAAVLIVFCHNGTCARNVILPLYAKQEEQILNENGTNLCVAVGSKCLKSFLC